MIIPEKEYEITDAQVFEALNLDISGLHLVQQAVLKKDYETAKRELVSYMHTRTNVFFLFDYRGCPLKPLPQEEPPYFFQASVGLQENIKDFCMYAGRRLMEHDYVIPGNRNSQVNLGEAFENLPHFHYPIDEGKKSRRVSNLFTRGQWMEYLAVLYQEMGEEKTAALFETLLKKFFEEYPLIIENTNIDANHFQHTEDRTVMSVGWLSLTYIEMLYTELAYSIDYKITFEIIKHLWFLGMQFRRFDNDTYRPYNHHLWERGLVPFILGTMFPEIPAFVSMKTKGAAVICRHVKEDFHTSGGYSEHSVGYWANAMLGEMLFKGIYLARKNHELVLDEEAQKKLEKTFELLALISPPSDFFPAIGDGAGPLVNDILHMGSSITNSTYCQEILDVRNGKKTKFISAPLYYSNDRAGFVCGRTHWGDRASFFLMSAKTNCGGSGHNHMDMLSLNLTIRGEEMIGEPYAADLFHKGLIKSRQRGYLYNMESHNTVLAYEKPIAENEMYAHQYTVYRPSSPVTSFEILEHGIYVEAEHTGYSFCKHQRRVFFSKNGNLVLRDQITPGNRANYFHIQRWHLFPDVICRKLDDSAVLLEKNGVALLCIWNHVNKICLWKNEKILCPSIYPDSQCLGYIIDAEFGQEHEVADDISKSIADTAFIDVTDKTPEQKKELRELLRDITHYSYKL